MLEENSWVFRKTGQRSSGDEPCRKDYVLNQPTNTRIFQSSSLISTLNVEACYYQKKKRGGDLRVILHALMYMLNHCSTVM